MVKLGVLRACPHIHADPLLIHQADSDRGKDVASAPWFKLGPSYGEPEGTRINDHHLSLAEKLAERTRLAAKK